MYRPDAVGISSVEIIASGIITIIVEVRREVPALSCTPAIMTSRIEMSEVNPAKRSEPKNRNPMSAPAGACEIMVGKAMKAKPIPSSTTLSTAIPCACAMKPSAANTPIPASSSNPELAKPTTAPEPVRSVLGFR